MKRLSGLDASGLRIPNVGTPTAPADALPLAYADVTYPRLDGSNAGPLGYRNVLIDGRLDFWLEGTSTSTNGYGSATMWRLLLGGGAAATLSQQAFNPGQGTVPGEPVYFARLARTTTGTSATSITQRIKDVRTLAGRTARARFFARASAAITVDVRANQQFGTGGSASSGNAVTGLAVGTSWAPVSGVISIASLAGKTIATDGTDYLEFRIDLPVAAGNVSLDLALVMLAEGSVDTAFEYRGADVELARVMRFYQSTYDPAFLPGTTNAYGAFRGRTTTTAANNLTINWPLPVIMAAQPTVTFYSTGTGASGSCRNLTSATDIPASLLAVSPKLIIMSHGATGADNVILFHIVADCRL